MTDQRSVRQLYQDVLLRYAKAELPAWPEDPATSDRILTGSNPTCGDDVELLCKISSGPAHSVIGRAKACAICRASLAMLVESAKSRSLDEMLSLAEAVTGMLESQAAEITPSPSIQQTDLGALNVVREFPMRLNCAALPWRTLKQAREQSHD